MAHYTDEIKNESMTTSIKEPQNIVEKSITAEPNEQKKKCRKFHYYYYFFKLFNFNNCKFD